MIRGSLVAAVILATTPAFAVPTAVKPGTPIGSDCSGPVSAVAPNFSVCPIGDLRVRVWCPDKTIMDVDGKATQIPLFRSVCGLMQTFDRN